MDRAPITEQLRMITDRERHGGEDVAVSPWTQFGHECDAIDAVHRNLEDENARLRANHKAMAEELARVTEESDAHSDKNAVGNVYVDVTPRINWEAVVQTRLKPSRPPYGSKPKMIAETDLASLLDLLIELEKRELRVCTGCFMGCEPHKGTRPYSCPEPLRRWAIRHRTSVMLYEEKG